jgi:hypothetical protein
LIYSLNLIRKNLPQNIFHNHPVGLLLFQAYIHLIRSIFALSSFSSDLSQAEQIYRFAFNLLYSSMAVNEFHHPILGKIYVWLFFFLLY